MARQSGLIDTLTGSGIPGYSGDGGPVLRARLNSPRHCALDGSGGLFIADTGNHAIRLVDLVADTIYAFAGSGRPGYSGDGGPATQATLNEPSAIAVTPAGDVYICDRLNRCIRKVDGATGIISTVAGEARGSIPLDNPQSISLDPRGGLLICDTGGRLVFRLDLETGTAAPFAGTGKPGPTHEGAAAFEANIEPAAVAAAADGSVYVAESVHHRILRITGEGVVEIVSGTGEPGFTGDGGPALSATYRAPGGLAWDPSGYIYIADTGNNVVRRLVLGTGEVERVAGGRQGYGGDGRLATAASLSRPVGSAVDSDGQVFIADTGNHCIRIVESAGDNGDEFGEDAEDVDEIGRRRGRGAGPPDE